ncbi:EF-hand domain-containing protein [Pseudoscourfieldia marina]
MDASINDVARSLFASVVDLNGDHNGVLSADELRAWLERNGEETLSNALLAQLDTDGDGAVSLQEFVDGFRNMRGSLAKVGHKDSPVYRAVALAWLAQFVKAHTGTTHSWDVVKEFMNDEDGGGTDTVLTVTSNNLETHRDKRRAAEKTKSGKPVPVQYRDIPFEQMYTTDIVECFVRSVAREEHKSYAQAKNLPVGAPTYFISHAWGSTFVDLVKSVTGALAGAAQADTYVWLDIFAINQDDTGGVFSAMHELDDGRTLAGTIATSRATLVVLDKERVIPLTRLWCLYEIGSTPPQKLQLVTHGFSEKDVSQHIRNIDAETALCFSPADKEMIHGEITGKFGFASMQHFTEELKLRFMLRPMSYESDLQALRERGQSNEYQLEELRTHVTSTGGRLACIVGGPGEGKSSVAAAALDLVHASHFCKRADVRRQDVLEMVRSLGFQLGQRFDVVRECLIDLDEDTAAEALVDPDVAVSAILVEPLKELAEIQKHAVILLDALDEADDDRHISNAAVGLLRHLARDVRSSVSVLVTTRPDADGDYPRRRVLEHDWEGGMRVMEPAQVLGQTSVEVEKEESRIPGPWEEAMRNMQSIKVYQIVAREFVKRYGTNLEPPADIDAAYKLWFDRAAKDDEEVRRLIDVVLASREPLSSAHVDRLRLRETCERLPGWGLLFEERDHLLQTLHLSLREFLGDTKRSGEHAADVFRGHRELARSCLHVLKRGDDEKGPAVAYSLRHAHVHLTEVVEKMLHEGGDETLAIDVMKEWHAAFLVEREKEALMVPEGYNASPWCATHFAGLWLKRQMDAGRRGVLVVELLRLEKVLLEAKQKLVDDATGLVATEESLHAFVRVLRWGVGTYSQAGLIAANVPCTSVWYQSPGQSVLTSCTACLPARVDIDATILNNMKGHSRDVNSASYSVDGTRIVSASDDETVRVWDATTGACLSVLDGDSGAVSSASYSADGTRIVSASSDETVRIWDATTGACISVLEGHSENVSSASYSADGTRIVSASDDKTVRIWDATTGACVSVLEGHSGRVSSASYSADGTRIVSASEDKTVRVWDATTGACISVLEGRSDSVSSASYSADGTRIVSASRDKTVRVWDAMTGACIYVLEGHSENVSSASYSADGTRIVSASEDETVRIWDATTGACVSVLEGHSGPVYSASYSADGTRIVSASSDETVRIWDATTGACVSELEGRSDSVFSASYSADGTRIVSASWDETVRIWDATTGACVSVLEGHSGPVYSASYSADGTRVVSASKDKTVRIWDATTGACISELEGHVHYVTSASYSADGTRIVSASEDKTVRVWDATTGACVSVLEGHSGPVNSASYSADGTRIVSASGSFGEDNTVRIWDATTGACVSVLEGHSAPVTSASYSADGTRVVSASKDETVRIWDATTGACISVLEGHSGWVNSASYSADGTRIVSASDDKTVRVWDATTGACLSVLESHSDRVNSASYSADGTRIVSASWDKTVLVWDVRSTM